VRNPSRLTFDMGVFKHFVIKESTSLEFRAEAFNIFNHTQLYLTNSNGATNSFGTGSFGEIGSAHLARILQFSLKFLF
jgi:hypothetical protein